LAGTNTLYFEAFSFPNDHIININDFEANPWNSRREVKIGLLSEYLNNEYPLPYDTEIKEYLWLPGQYPVNSDGKYLKWTT
jgi:hypothetical protein